jgi:hypothetical protein
VWAGEYRQLKPVDFKETLADAYPQFRGTQQHDCQVPMLILRTSVSGTDVTI